jgi:acetate kinase
VTASGTILTINAGSSSLKFALFDATGTLAEMARGEIESLDSAPHFIARDGAGVTLAEHHWGAGIADAFGTALAALISFADRNRGQGGLKAVGHRVVHGGAAHILPALVTPVVLADLRSLTKLDPLHMPHNLAPMQAIAALHPDLPQVACFDTAFHHTLPPVARTFALPRALTEAGVRRYGFHGLSYEFIAGRLAEVAPTLAQGRVIAAHLGAGASLCALHGGISVATTTGFSALDGLMMATRCGRLDPGVLLYLGQQGHSSADIEDMLYRRCGLLGVSGISGDLRVLLQSTDPHAREAIDLFTHSIACEAGSLVSALGGLDGLVFTAGIGEHAPAIRMQVANRLSWLGVRLDEAANAANAPCISTPDSRIEVRVIATNEEAMIARHTISVSRATPIIEACAA